MCIPYDVYSIYQTKTSMVIKLSLPDHMCLLQVWFYDGSVECYTGVHLLLSIFAISLLIFLGLLVPIVALIVYHNKLSEKVCLE